MDADRRPPGYRTYLLTLWEEQGRDGHARPAWRFSLADPRTGERRGYAHLEELMDALEQEMRGDRASNPPSRAVQS